MILNFLLLLLLLSSIAGFFKVEKAIDLLDFSKLSNDIYDYFFYENKSKYFLWNPNFNRKERDENLSGYFF